MRDPGTLTVSIHESGRHLFPGHGVHRRAGGGERRRNVRQPAAGAVHRCGRLADGGPGAGADPRCRVRSRRRGEPARGGLARVGSAGAPAGDDDGDGGGGQAGGRGCPSLGRRSVAGDGRRRVRRVPGGAASVGADLAGRGASRAGAIRRRSPGASGGSPLQPRSGRRGCRRRSWMRPTPACPTARPRRPPTSLHWRHWPACGRWCCRGSCARPRTGAGGGRHLSGPDVVADGRGHAALDRRPTAVPAGTPALRVLAVGDLGRLSLAPRVIAPFDPDDGRSILDAALADGGRVIAAVVGDAIVGVAVAAPSLAEAGTESLLAVGVAPAWRGDGLGRALLRALVDGVAPGVALEAQVGVAERDVGDPLDVEERLARGAAPARRRGVHGTSALARRVPRRPSRDHGASGAALGSRNGEPDGPGPAQGQDRARGPLESPNSGRCGRPRGAHPGGHCVQRTTSPAARRDPPPSIVRLS